MAALHNMTLYSKFKQCCERLKHSSFRREDLPRIINSDINSIIVYASYANYMPIKGKINFGETGMITSVNFVYYAKGGATNRKKLLRWVNITYENGVPRQPPPLFYGYGLYNPALWVPMDQVKACWAIGNPICGGGGGANMGQPGF